MREVVQMVLVLFGISTVCGAALSGIRQATAERIEYQVLMNVQGPKVNKVLAGSENDLISDRAKLLVKGEKLLLFVGKKGGRPWAVAYETTGKGFGGELKLMVGYDLKEDKLVGIEVVSHKETPGLGSRVTEDQFKSQFAGREIDARFLLKNGGGDIDAVSGATISSRAVCEAIRKSIALYPEVKRHVLQNIGSKG